MKRVLLLMMILSMGFVSQAQLDIDMSELSIEGSEMTADFDHHFDVLNTTGEEVTAYWELIPSEDFPEEWETFLCDNNLCYTPWVKNCPEGSPNMFAPNQTQQWILHLKPKGVMGTAQMTLRLHYPQASGDSLSVDHVFQIAAGTSSTVEIDLAELLIYPNPATDYIQIRNDESIKQINVYNVVGKQLRSFNHTAGQSHSVQDLNKGIYLVRLMNTQGEVVKSMKLSKR